MAGAALGIALVALGGKVAGLAQVETYPTIAIDLGPPELVLSCALLTFAVLPFAGRAARIGVANA